MVSLKLFVLLLTILVGVAFLTLFERKTLGYIQTRKGPNKVGIDGFLQPLGDAVKLFSKEVISPQVSNTILFYLSPILSFAVILILWLSMPSSYGVRNIYLRLIFILCCLRRGVYPVLVAG